MGGGIRRTMLSGFNTNFRYRGVLFHVQTEDSGRDNPHVITHLFHGGNIMASHKSDYSSLIGDGDIEDAVREMMEGQHKAMLKQLSRGEHDAVIAQRLGPDVFRIDPEEAAEPASITEESPAESEAESVLQSGEESESALSVVAEHTQIGDSAESDVILEPEFATELPPATPTAEGEDLAAASKASRTDAEAAESNPESRAASQLSRVFGDRVVSEKPLDEVVMDYLVDNARKRKRQSK